MRYITEIFNEVLQGIKSLILTSTDPGNKHTADIATNRPYPCFYPHLQQIFVFIKSLLNKIAVFNLIINITYIQKYMSYSWVWDIEDHIN